ncbi:MAG: hypothetical protein QM486_05115 [Flavobacteriaceae bacterium]
MKNKKQLESEVVKGVETSAELITRKEAIQKAARYMALTALSTFIILNPKKAQAQSGGPGAPKF